MIIITQIAINRALVIKKIRQAVKNQYCTRSTVDNRRRNRRGLGLPRCRGTGISPAIVADAPACLYVCAQRSLWQGHRGRLRYRTRLNRRLRYALSRTHKTYLLLCYLCLPAAAAAARGCASVRRASDETVTATARSRERQSK